ncbi:MAG: hypothetical protein AAGB25_06580, partial [Pseudomonadota bacterium]
MTLAPNLHAADLPNGFVPQSLASGVSEEDVREAQDKWAAGVVDIGRVYREGEDYVARAAKHV